MEYNKSYLRVVDKEIDIIAQRINICPALMLNRAYCKYKSYGSFIRELNDQSWHRNPQLGLNISTTISSLNSGYNTWLKGERAEAQSWFHALDMGQSPS